MWLIPKNGEDVPRIYKALLEQGKPSRFVWDMEACAYRRRRTDRGRAAIEIRRVRLIHAKDYCGQHPGPCQLGFFPKKHRRGRWLEGADWVGFDNLVNDVLDRLEIDAKFFSFNREALGGLYYLRKGRRRRTHFGMVSEYRFGRELVAWAEADDCDFEDCIGKDRAEIACRWPDSTPGQAVYLMVDEQPEFEHVD